MNNFSKVWQNEKKFDLCWNGKGIMVVQNAVWKQFWAILFSNMLGLCKYQREQSLKLQDSFMCAMGQFM
jgi:hypothetical protein